jgi:hypothetical protein
MKRIIELFFGVRKNGEPVSVMNCVVVRDVDFSEFEKWCKEFNVGCRTDRSKFTFIH